MGQNRDLEEIKEIKLITSAILEVALKPDSVADDGTDLVPNGVNSNNDNSDIGLNAVVSGTARFYASDNTDKSTLEGCTVIESRFHVDLSECIRTERVYMGVFENFSPN